MDGKTLRRSFDKAGKKGAIHMVSAWCSAQNLVLGQTKVNEKSNEITAIPELLDLLQIKGAIITIDAMGCQREIAQKILDKKAPYISSLVAEAEFMAGAIRDHWGVENSLHWVMDMVFRDDECRIRKKNAPANFATIKHVASNLLRLSKGKRSMRQKRHQAAWNEDYLFELITT